MFKQISTIGALALASLSFTGVAVAAGDNNGQNSGQNNGQGQTQQLMQTYRQDAQKLKQIHTKTLQSDPKLAKEQKQFQHKIQQAIKKQGYDVQAGQKRMKAMAQKLQSGKNLSDKQRQQVMQKFQGERQKMVKARNAALSQPRIKKAGQKLQKDTIAAMNKQNSNTSHLISEMKSVRGKLQQSAGSNGAGQGH